MPDDPTMPADPTAPHVDLDPAAVFDLELVLMRVLQGAQPLGMPLTVADPATPGADPPVVRLQLPEELADRAAAAGSVVLRDHESTPLALLEDVRVDPPASAGPVLDGCWRDRPTRRRCPVLPAAGSIACKSILLFYATQPRPGGHNLLHLSATATRDT